MSILILGANGKTGKQLVAQLLTLGQALKVIVRPQSQIPAEWHGIENLTITREDITQFNEHKISFYLQDCMAVVSCLGHKPTRNLPELTVIARS